MANIQKKIEISIIIVNYKTENYVKNLVSKFGNETNLEVIIVDNSNNKELSDYCKKYKNTTYIPQTENKGFSHANNIGIKESKGTWVLLLNSDTDTEAKTIYKLLDFAIQKKVLVSAPRLIYADKKIQNSVAYFDPISKNPINYIFARPRFLKCETIHENTIVDFATGAALLIDRSVFQKIGFLDEDNFFVYYEDLDFCQRLRENGIGILYVPEISITHFEGKSSNIDMEQKNINYKHGLKRYLLKHRGIAINLLNNIFHFLL